MRTIEVRSEEYADAAVDDRVTECEVEEVDFYFDRDDIKEAFTDGAEWMRDELTRWNYPKEKLPNDGREVLCVIHKKYNTYAVLKFYQGEWWQPAPVPAGGWCGYDGEIIAWREINE